MSPRVLAALFALVGGSALIIALGGGDEPTPEEVIQGILDEAVVAAEAHDLAALMDPVSDDFAGTAGMDRDRLKGFLLFQLRRGDWRRVFLVGSRITVERPAVRANVVTTAVLASGERVERVEDVVPTSAGTYRLNLSFEVEDDRWMVVGAEHERVPFESLF